jgi:hypothetical protein
MPETFRLKLNRDWEAVEIQTGAPVVIPAGLHKAVRVQYRTNPQEKEEPWLVIMVAYKGNSTAVGLREAFWRQWEGHHIPELRVTIGTWMEHTLGTLRPSSIEGATWQADSTPSGSD